MVKNQDKFFICQGGYYSDVNRSPMISWVRCVGKAELTRLLVCQHRVCQQSGNYGLRPYAHVNGGAMFLWWDSWQMQKVLDGKTRWANMNNWAVHSLEYIWSDYAGLFWGYCPKSSYWQLLAYKYRTKWNRMKHLFRCVALFTSSFVTYDSLCNKV